MDSTVNVRYPVSGYGNSDVGQIKINASLIWNWNYLCCRVSHADKLPAAGFFSLQRRVAGLIMKFMNRIAFSAPAIRDVPVIQPPLTATGIFFAHCYE
jgi:hypothetical protein